ncbi:MAG: group II intron maturase-specific domain-containing protein [Planctomycetota bacterium]|nr:group II intron maturase-specific domain-containing protein [Planctomycetota bacterium]
MSSSKGEEYEWTAITQKVTAECEGVQFLRVVIRSVHTGIDRKKVAVFTAKGIADLSPVLWGWGNYFRMANCKRHVASWRDGFGVGCGTNNSRYE